VIHALSRDGRAALTALGHARALLAFDFDGTLAPIVASRDDAHMRRETAALFSRVCELYPCAVISGRGRRDVGARLEGCGVRYVVGNHGLEPGGDMARFELQVSVVGAHVERALAEVQGVDVEDKRYSLAVHYRRSRAKRAATQAIHEAAASAPHPMRTVGGKMVVNLIPEGAPSKGDALLELRARSRSDVALFVGDDVTDEDVFELDQPGRLLSIRVGRSATSAAAYYLKSQGEIDALLAHLAGVRAAPP
jgi:trehalose 6-phosphate phosphatase